MYEKFISSSASPKPSEHELAYLYKDAKRISISQKYKDKSLIIRHQIHVKT